MAIAPQFLQQQYGQGGYGQFSPVQQYTPNGGDWWDTLSEFFTGTPESYDIFNKFNPQQMNAIQQLLSSGQQNMQNPYEGFEPLQQETMNRFYQDILPGIKEQFAGQRGGALSSPDFGSQLSSGASGLSALLNAQKARYGQQNKQFGLQQIQQGLTPQFDIQPRERSAGLFSGENIGNNAQTILKLLPYLL
jgi:hypothetical protein